MPTAHLIIEGKVQGVFFRATAKDRADELGITGWAKNTEEGHVEIMANGNNEQLQQFIAWCKVGPRRAIVSKVIVENAEPENFKNFEIIRKY